MEVGIRELRAHLSAYLERVLAGEELTVTDHGVAVATIVPRGERRWDRLVAEGAIEPAVAPRGRPAKRIKAKGTISDLVAEQRR